jgi:fumarate reductase iron-sulfur subunit
MSDKQQKTRCMANDLRVEIWRGGEKGRLVRYDVPARANQTVLDVVTWIQRNLEPALAYRFACRVGVCGSCAMTVNGKARWTCRTHVSKVADDGGLIIEPLRNLPRIRDLVTDFKPFFDAWTGAGGVFAGAQTRAQAPAAVDPQSEARKAADAGIECINCAACYSSCDVVAWDRSYLGPAALNRSWTLLNDERHVEKRSLLDKVQSREGAYRCHTLGNCARACPVGINPTQAIAGLKQARRASA